MSRNPIVIMALLAAPVLTVALLAWLVGIWTASDCRNLAKLYPAQERPAGDVFRFRSLEIAYSSNHFPVTFVVSPSGLYIAGVGPFRIGRPAMLIPWSAMEITSNSLMLEAWVRVTPPSITLRITPIIFDAAREYLGASAKDR